MESSCFRTGADEEVLAMDILLKGKYLLGLLLAAGIGAWLVRAEERQDWLTAQASLVVILLLLPLMAWGWWKANYQSLQLSGEAGVYDRATNKVLVCVGTGFAALILNANRWDRWKYGGVARAIGYGALLAGAFFIGGALLGYLFGLRPTNASASQSSSSPSPPHTNLEEIADWLTKLILGAGLVELTRLRGPIGEFTAFIATGVNPPFFSKGERYEDPGSPAIALAIMSFFSASGLLYGYLWTRYQQARKDADTKAAPNRPVPEDDVRARAA
jgi:hypothetical protein